MHAQSAKNYGHFKACRAYETAFALKAEGRVRHVGLSFHDSAEVLEQILTEYPAIEAVQLQFNYADYDDPKVQSRKCYEVCVKHGKPVIVMEPVKGGNPGQPAGKREGRAGRAARRKRGELRDSLCGGLPRRDDGALRHERHGADAG